MKRRSVLIILLFFILGVLVTLYLNTSFKQHRKDTNRMKGLGYVSGDRSIPKQTGVTKYNASKSWEGLNLYVSCDGPVARLVDMEGELLHKWKITFEDAFPTRKPKLKIATDTMYHCFRNFYAFPNGDLLVIFERLGLVKIDRNSRVKWSKMNYAHHDLTVDTQGNVYVLTRSARAVDYQGNTLSIADENVSIYDSKGDFINSYSIYEFIKESDYYGLMEYIDLSDGYDLLHTNAVELVHDNDYLSSKKADILVSSRSLNSILALDFQTREVVWALSGLTSQQHDPILSDQGDLLIFDNGVFRGRSRVIQVDPYSRRIIWEHSRGNFYTRCCGGNQILPNNNVLITVTSQGEVFEVTRDHRIVWRYVSPHEAWNRDKKVASIYAIKRYRNDYFDFISSNDGS